MYSKFANFFIQNSKLTTVLVIVTLFSGIGSYIIIPKQYNPTIVVPAFSIMLEAPALSSNEVKKLVTDELENKIMELEGIDETYGVSGDNYAGVMVKFKVGEDKEKAKIRLNQKLLENMDLKPMGVGNPIITTMDPDELSQITYAISFSPHPNPLPRGEGTEQKQEDQNISPLPLGEGSGVRAVLNEGELLSQEEQSIYLRQVANIIKNKLKTLESVTTLDIVGGAKKNIVVDLDLSKIEARNTDIMQIHQALQKNNLSMPAGNINLENGDRIFVETNAKVDNIEKLKKLVVAKVADVPLYLGDVADIRYGEQRTSKYSLISNKTNLGENAVFLGVGKQAGTNGVFVTEAVKEKMEEIKKTLPTNIEVSVIQDEGKNAKEATNTLIKDLLESILIVVILLVIFLGPRNALNTATSIPIILALVFLYSYIVGYNINRISLFALILVIGMLVDDSIVVVENIHRHLEERVHTGKTKLEAILLSVNEVGPGVIMSTITKVFAFASMFAVTGMMGEYMGPIPKFAIVALLLSILVAFSINPWISYLTAKDITEDDKNHKIKKKSKYDIRIFYVKVMEFFINAKPNFGKRRKIFKLVFWISLFVVIIAPIYMGIFKARMLPKSNQDQVYLWLDSNRGTNAVEMLKVEKDIENFFLKNDKLPKELDIVSSISSTIGTPFTADFANLFRGGSQRMQEFQISSRINLIQKELNKDRIKSEIFAFQVRPLLREYLLQKYPDLNMRLLEDPPGPPVRATFMMKIKTEGDVVSLNNFTKKVYSEVQKIAPEQKLVDLGNSLSTTYKKISIDLDHESLTRAGLTVEQIAYTLSIAKSSIQISLIKDSSSLEATNIILGVKGNQTETTDLLKNISFTNPEGKKIFLASIAKIDYSFVAREINTDKRQETNYIYAEMGDNSVIYPIIELYSILKSQDFLGKDFKFLGWDFYGLHYEGLKDGKKYDIEWDGEWKLTMDTFRDLGTAMIIAILAIYFLIVGQFRSFAVAGVVMLPFLLGFFGIFPGFSALYLIKNEYFNATAMIGIISLAGIVVGNAILLIDYVNTLKSRGWTIEKAIIEAGYIRFMPIMLTSMAAIFGAAKITGDPVWSGLARSIVWGLATSAILTLIAIPIFYYDSQKKIWDTDIMKDKIKM